MIHVLDLLASRAYSCTAAVPQYLWPLWLLLPWLTACLSLSLSLSSPRQAAAATHMRAARRPTSIRRAPQIYIESGAALGGPVRSSTGRPEAAL